MNTVTTSQRWAFQGIFSVLALSMTCSGTPMSLSEAASQPTAEPDDPCPEADLSWKHRRSGERIVVLIGEAEGINYLEVVIGNVAMDAALPMIVAIHGLGYRPRMPEPPLLGLSHPVRVIFPRAPDAFGKGFSWLPLQVRDGQPDKLADALQEKAALLARALQTWTTRHATVGKPIVLGFSQGGMLTWTLALQHPQLISVAMPLAAWLPPRLIPQTVDDPLSYPPLRMMHGRMDRTIAIEPTRLIVRQMQRQGLRIDWLEYGRAGHTMSKVMDAQLHRWLNEAIKSQLATPSDIPGS